MGRSAASKVFLFAAVYWAFAGLPLRGEAAPKPRQDAASAGKLVVDLDGGWRFRQGSANGSKEGEWLPATVPGDVHLDLLANKKISDPFFRDNEKQLQWIEKANWEYELDFEAGADLLKRANIELVFEGLDAAAEVDVNGAHVLGADNMFRTWRVPVKGHLHAGKNVLHIVFPSPIEAAAAVAARDPWQPKIKTEAKTYIRKAAYEYGWDWGPRFVTSGIWRPVRLEAWNKCRIADFAIRQKDVTGDVAHLDAEVEIEASASGAAQLNVQYMADEKPVTIGARVMLHLGRNLINLPVEIERPRLWYPAGYGDQPLYEFTARIAAAGQTADQRTVKTGLRSIELRREPDKWGRSFELVVNGIPIFAKGANVIPFDSFPSRVTTEQYRRILQSAHDANMNMVRLWGGGYYESDDFYAICDELGIMVWQDFMFGNDWQPGTYEFKQNIEAEAEDQVRRLRNHPSLMLWCGNNETEIALNWGDRWALPADVRLQMQQDYLTEFSGILNRVVETLDAEIPYWPSSPSTDYEATSDRFVSGDAHDWSVWHDRAPFSDYEKHHWRFVTEFGFQSLPEMRTVASFTDQADRTGIFTPGMLAHQKNADGNAIIQEYMRRDYPEPKDFPSTLYLSQVLQAEGIKEGAEHFRRERPETMGALFWQLNDCWPVASWSSIDYYGRWKALQFYARRFYAPVLVSPVVEGNVIKVYIVSDRTDAQAAQLRVRLMDFDGKVLIEESHSVSVSPLSSKVYVEWPWKKLTDAGATETARFLIAAELSDGGQEISRNLLYLAPVGEVRLKPAPLKTAVSGGQGKYTVRVSSQVLARDVYLSFGDLDAEVTDNYFDLLPGETREIAIHSAAALEMLKAQMQAISLEDAFAAGSRPTAILMAP
jgi:beta-mannosidase